MEAVENFENEIIFNNISYLITNRTKKLSTTSELYLLSAIEYLNNLIKSLDSLYFTTQNGISGNDSFIIFPNLKEVVSSVPNSPQKISEKDIEFIKKYFEEVITEINNLKNNPEKFYSSKKSEELRRLSETLSLIHSETFRSHSFETEETFSNSYI